MSGSLDYKYILHLRNNQFKRSVFDLNECFKEHGFDLLDESENDNPEKPNHYKRFFYELMQPFNAQEYEISNKGQKLELIHNQTNGRKKLKLT